MIEEWLRQCEHIAHSAVINGTGVLGFTSVEGFSGVTTLALMVAEICARSGNESSYVDLTTPIKNIATVPEPATQEREPIWRRIDGATFPILVAHPTSMTQYQFNNLNWVRQIFEQELASRKILIVDLPPVLAARSGRINPVAPLVACDSVLLICRRGHDTRPRIKEAAALLRSAGATVSGIVLNDFDYHTPGEEIGLTARRMLPFAPNFARWIDRRARHSSLLN